MICFIINVVIRLLTLSFISQYLWQPENTPSIKSSSIRGTVQIVASASSASDVQPAAKLPVKNLLQDVELLKNAKNDLQHLPEFHGKKLRVYGKIDFFNGTRPRIEIQVENPNMPNTLLFYTFERGKWTKGIADDVSHIKNLSRQMTSLEDIDFTQVAQIAATWKQKAIEVQAVEQEPYHVMFVWLPAQNKRFWHTATLEAQGKQFYLSMHLNGSIWEFKGLSSKKSEDN